MGGDLLGLDVVVLKLHVLVGAVLEHPGRFLAEALAGVAAALAGLVLGLEVVVVGVTLRDLLRFFSDPKQLLSCPGLVSNLIRILEFLPRPVSELRPVPNARGALNRIHAHHISRPLRRDRARLRMDRQIDKQSDSLAPLLHQVVQALVLDRLGHARAGLLCVVGGAAHGRPPAVLPAAGRGARRVVHEGARLQISFLGGAFGAFQQLRRLRGHVARQVLVVVLDVVLGGRALRGLGTPLLAPAALGAGLGGRWLFEI